MEDPNSRFSDRVEYYAKYRPGYPREVLEFLYGEVVMEYEVSLFCGRLR